MFAGGGSLLRVTLWGYDQPEHLGDLVEVLHELVLQAPNLIALTVGVPSVEGQILRAACLFPYLETLRLETGFRTHLASQACKHALDNRICEPTFD
jgi:hypothetical protein